MVVQMFLVQWKVRMLRMMDVPTWGQSYTPPWVSSDSSGSLWSISAWESLYTALKPQTDNLVVARVDCSSSSLLVSGTF